MWAAQSVTHNTYASPGSAKLLRTAFASPLLCMFLLQLIASLFFLLIMSNMTCLHVDFINGLWWLLYITSMITIKYIYQDMDNVEDTVEVCCETSTASPLSWICWLPEGGEYV